MRHPWDAPAAADDQDGRDYVCTCARLRPPGTPCVCGRGVAPRSAGLTDDGFAGIITAILLGALVALSGRVDWSTMPDVVRQGLAVFASLLVLVAAVGVFAYVERGARLTRYGLRS